MKLQREALSSDLMLLGISSERHTADVTIWTIASAICASAFFMLLNMILNVGPIVTAIICGALAVLGCREPARRVRNRAHIRRKELEHSFAAFLDLVNILLAGGAGIESAFLAAGAAGDGWCFHLFRDLMGHAREERTDMWNMFRDVGMSFDIDSMVDVANSLQLAGQHGSRVRQSLAAKATSLRVRSMAQIEHDAAQQTERMGVPMVLLFVGFIILLGYPAFANTLGVL
jgi:tight adherence protein C